MHGPTDVGRLRQQRVDAADRTAFGLPQCGEGDSATVQAIVSGARQGDTSMAVLASAAVRASDGSQILALSYVDQYQQPPGIEQGVWRVKTPHIYSLSESAYSITFWPVTQGDDAAITEAQQCLSRQSPHPR